MGSNFGLAEARVDLSPMPESTLSSSQGLRIWPLDSSLNNSKEDKQRGPPVEILMKKATLHPSQREERVSESLGSQGRNFKI